MKRSSMSIVIIGLILLSFMQTVQATYAPPTFVAVGTFATSTGADVTPALPVGWEPGDIFLLIGIVEDVDDSVILNGWTAFSGSPFSRASASRHWQFWIRATAGMAAPLFDKSTATGATAVQIIAYRGAITTNNPWEVVGASFTGTTDPAPCTGITSLSDGSLVVGILTGEDDNNLAIVTTGTQPINYVEHYAEDTVGGGILVTFSEMNRQVAGATGSVSIDFNSAVPIGWGCRTLSLKGAIQVGINSLIKQTVESPGANCATGGQKIESVLDDGSGGGIANDGILQAGEVDATSYVCNGAMGPTGPTGPPGTPGTNGTNGTNGINGTNGLNGTDASVVWVIFVIATSMSIAIVGWASTSTKRKD